MFLRIEIWVFKNVGRRKIGIQSLGRLCSCILDTPAGHGGREPAPKRAKASGLEGPPTRAKASGLEGPPTGVYFYCWLCA